MRCTAARNARIPGGVPPALCHARQFAPIDPTLSEHFDVRRRHRRHGPDPDRLCARDGIDRLRLSRRRTAQLSRGLRADAQRNQGQRDLFSQRRIERAADLAGHRSRAGRRRRRVLRERSADRDHAVSVGRVRRAGADRRPARSRALPVAVGAARADLRGEFDQSRLCADRLSLQHAHRDVRARAELARRRRRPRDARRARAHAGRAAHRFRRRTAERRPRPSARALAAAVHRSGVRRRAHPDRRTGAGRRRAVRRARDRIRARLSALVGAVECGRRHVLRDHGRQPARHGRPRRRARRRTHRATAGARRRARAGRCRRAGVPRRSCRVPRHARQDRMDARVCVVVDAHRRHRRVARGPAARRVAADDRDHVDTARALPSSCADGRLCTLAARVRQRIAVPQRDRDVADRARAHLARGRALHARQSRARRTRRATRLRLRHAVRADPRAVSRRRLERAVSDRTRAARCAGRGRRRCAAAASGSDRTRCALSGERRADRRGRRRDREAAAGAEARRSGARGRLRECGEIVVPGRDEPRDPHAAERDPRQSRTARALDARPAAAQPRADAAQRGVGAARARQRHSRFHEGRGRRDAGRVDRIRRDRRDRARVGRVRTRREGEGAAAVLRNRGERVAADARRSDAARAGVRQSAQQRDQVHRARTRDRARARRARRMRHGGARDRDRGYGDRHRQRGSAQAVPCVLAGRRDDRPPLRRHGPRARAVRSPR
ncbi:hypothetical protein FEP76_05713 [Burkholderia multivorans]|nr:hypothetical protein [Burkholderia multivorans]